MADPISIIGCVSAILELISLGHHIVTVARDLRKATDELDANREESIVVKDIETILGNLRPPTNDDSPADIEPLRLRALVLAAELKVSLTKLVINGERSSWKVIKVAIRNVWDKKKIMELDNRLRGLSLALNTRLTADSSQLLEKMTVQQQQQFEVVRNSISAIQALQPWLCQQHEYFSAELQEQSRNIQDSSIANTLALQESITTQLDMLREASGNVASKIADMEDKLDRMDIKDEALRERVESVVTSAIEVQNKTARADQILGSVDTHDLEAANRKIARAQAEVLKGYDKLAQYIFCVSEAAAAENVLPDSKSTSGISDMGHTYSGTSSVTISGIHIQGDLGESKKSGNYGPKNLYSGNTTVSGNGIVVSGTILDPNFLPWNR